MNKITVENKRYEKEYHFFDRSTGFKFMTNDIRFLVMKINEEYNAKVPMQELKNSFVNSVSHFKIAHGSNLSDIQVQEVIRTNFKPKADKIVYLS